MLPNASGPSCGWVATRNRAKAGREVIRRPRIFTLSRRTPRTPFRHHRIAVLELIEMPTSLAALTTRTSPSSRRRWVARDGCVVGCVVMPTAMRHSYLRCNANCWICENEPGAARHRRPSVMLLLPASVLSFRLRLAPDVPVLVREGVVAQQPTRGATERPDRQVVQLR